MSEESTNPDDDLRSRLHAMETKIRRMRDNRNGHNENARRAADSRNAVQEQAKGIRESIDELKAKQKKSETKPEFTRQGETKFKATLER